MPPPSVPARSKDAVVQLVGSIWDDALDPGYAAAASRRDRAGTGSGTGTGAGEPGRHRPAVRAAVAFAVVGALLSVALLATHAAAPAVAQRRDALVDRIHQATAADTAQTDQVTALQAEVARLKAETLSTTDEGSRLAQQLADLDLATAQTGVTGPGLRITMDDAQTPPAGTDPNVDRVLDRDLQSVVNGLWAAGAEAIAVDDQRLTALSAIRSAGDAILVDYRPLTRPYVVTAIGDPHRIGAAFAASAAGRGLTTLSQTYGITATVDQVDQVTLPAASSVGLRYARAKEGAAP